MPPPRAALKEVDKSTRLFARLPATDSPPRSGLSTLNSVDKACRFGQFLRPMYAVIETGGKQYKVAAGEVIQIEKLKDLKDPTKGTAVQFDKVLFVSEPGAEASKITLGKPYLEKALVKGELIGVGRGDKITIIKYRRRKDYRRKQGHRQDYHQVLITSLDSGAGSTEQLDAAKKKTIISRFTSTLAPKGPASQPKTLGSRVRMKGGPDQVAEVKKVKVAKKKTAAKKKKVAKKKVASKRRTAPKKESTPKTGTARAKTSKKTTKKK